MIYHILRVRQAGSNEMEVFVYFYVENWVLVEYLSQQEAEHLQHFSKLIGSLIFESSVLTLHLCINT